MAPRLSWEIRNARRRIIESWRKDGTLSRNDYEWIEVHDSAWLARFQKDKEEPKWTAAVNAALAQVPWDYIKNKPSKELLTRAQQKERIAKISVPTREQDNAKTASPPGKIPEAPIPPVHVPETNFPPVHPPKTTLAAPADNPAKRVKISQMPDAVVIGRNMDVAKSHGYFIDDDSETEYKPERPTRHEIFVAILRDDPEPKRSVFFSINVHGSPVLIVREYNKSLLPFKSTSQHITVKCPNTTVPWEQKEQMLIWNKKVPYDPGVDPDASLFTWYFDKLRNWKISHFWTSEKQRRCFPLRGYLVKAVTVPNLCWSAMLMHDHPGCIAIAWEIMKKHVDEISKQADKHERLVQNAIAQKRHPSEVAQIMRDGSTEVNQIMKRCLQKLTTTPLLAHRVTIPIEYQNWFDIVDGTAKCESAEAISNRAWNSQTTRRQCKAEAVPETEAPIFIHDIDEDFDIYP